MNILYLAHRIPYPPNKGDKIRSFRQLEHLVRSHRVWCGFFVDRPEDEQYVAVLRKLCEDVIAIRLRSIPAKLRGAVGWCGGSTVTESFYRHRGMAKAIHGWTGAVDFDVVVAFSSSMARLALSVPARRRVLDLCDLDSRKWLDYAKQSIGLSKLFYRTEGERLARKEMQWLAAFDATVVISDIEARPLLDRRGSHRLHVIRNGVALSNASKPTPPDTRDRPIVGFVGAMDYRPNVDAVTWFVKNCWQEVKAAEPRAEFRIVGRSPAPRVRRLARVKGVTVVGEVVTVATELDRLSVSVAPMRIARGLQNKVLEAMAAGKPVVLTSQAAEGIAAQDRRHFLVADRPDLISADVIAMLRDRDARIRVGNAARQYVESHHRWKDALREFELVVTGVSGTREAVVERAQPARAAAPSMTQ